MAVSYGTRPTRTASEAGACPQKWSALCPSRRRSSGEGSVRRLTSSALKHRHLARTGLRRSLAPASVSCRGPQRMIPRPPHRPACLTGVRTPAALPVSPASAALRDSSAAPHPSLRPFLCLACVQQRPPRPPLGLDMSRRASYSAFAAAIACDVAAAIAASFAFGR